MPRVTIPATPYKVSFYSFDLRERRHVHVRRERSECKVWIAPTTELAWNRGFAESELNDIFRLLEANLALINQTYDELFKRD